MIAPKDYARLAGGALARCPDCQGRLGTDEGTGAFCQSCGDYIPRGEWVAPAASNGTGSAAPAGLGPVVVALNTVEREEVDWLWEGRLARGRLTGLMGDPGAGKSWVTAAIGTAASLGAPLPGEERAREPMDVLYLACEDGLADTMRPRFEDLGADLTKIHIMTAVKGLDGKERHPSLVDDLADVERALTERHCKILVIDPINAYLGSQLDTHRDAALRSVLAPLAALCERLGVACIFVLHLTKSGRDRALYRGQGSIAYGAAARVVLLAGANPENPNEKAVCWIKGNLSEPAPTIGYEIRDGIFYWCESSLTADQILAPDADSGATGKLAEAERFLANELADGPRPSKALLAEAKTELGISERTMRTAKASLGVGREKRGFGEDGAWYWSLDPKAASLHPLTALDESVPETEESPQTVAALASTCGGCGRQLSVLNTRGLCGFCIGRAMQKRQETPHEGAT